MKLPYFWYKICNYSYFGTVHEITSIFSTGYAITLIFCTVTNRVRKMNICALTPQASCVLTTYDPHRSKNMKPKKPYITLFIYLIFGTLHAITLIFRHWTWNYPYFRYRTWDYTYLWFDNPITVIFGTVHVITPLFGTGRAITFFGTLYETTSTFGTGYANIPNFGTVH